MVCRRVTGRYLIGSLIVVATMTFAVAGNRWSSTTGEARLVAFEPLPIALTGETCEWDVAVPQHPTFAQSSAAASLPDASARMAVAARQPLRFIQDPYPSFSSIAVDAARNEVVVTDENRFRVIVYDRQANTPASATQTEPKRVINRVNTHTQYASDVYVDPPSGDIYVINNDTVHNTTIYSRQARGDARPDREFVSPYGNFGAAVDESRQEMYLTLQHNSAIMVYKKSSGMKDYATRLIQGDKTRMADPHGIAFDPRNRLLYVTNYGTSHSVKMGTTGQRGRPRVPNWPAGNYGSEIIPGTGKYELPSITVLPADAVGDVAPLRVIQGQKTGLNWPTGIAFDADRGELYVANAIGDMISVFGADQAGDVAPLRVLKGARTMLKYPSDVFLDAANDEMWVASYGNHMALAYKLGASGDTAPTRIIRGSPLNTTATLIGNPFSIAYDTKREEILVPSCVAHPRIAAFARTADKNAAPVRAIEGSKTHLNRTVHAIYYDEIHDEIVVPSDIGQAFLTFRGNATGDEAPIRVIQGPHTQIRKPSKLSVDPVNDEIFTFSGNTVMFFDRKANGDVPPKRILSVQGLNANNAAVDTVHNLLVVSGGNRIWIFDRTAEGNAQPRAVIGGGPKSGLLVGQGMTLYPPAGKIIVNVPGVREDDREEGDAFSPEGLASDKSYTAIWSIYDNGDVPPQWTIGGPKGHLRQPRGVTLDPKNKTIIVSDKFLNGVLTYSFPELFEAESPRQTAQAR